MATSSGADDLAPDDFRGAHLSGWSRYRREEGDLVVVTLQRQSARDLELRFTGVEAFKESEPSLTTVRALEVTSTASGLWQFTLVGERDGEAMQLLARKVCAFE